MVDKITLQVARYRPEQETEPTFQEYEVPCPSSSASHRGSPPAGLQPSTRRASAGSAPPYSTKRRTRSAKAGTTTTDMMMTAMIVLMTIMMTMTAMMMMTTTIDRCSQCSKH